MCVYCLIFIWQLLAYQKGKKKRKKKKATVTDSASEDIIEELSATFSENISSLDQTSLNSGNVSPIPFDHTSAQVCKRCRLCVSEYNFTHLCLKL